MGRHVAKCLTEGTYAACVVGTEIAGDPIAYDPVIYAPKTALDHPFTQLLLGTEVDDTRVRTLDIARDLPPAPIPDGPVLYLIPISEQASIHLLQDFYPSATVHALPLDEGPTQFVAIAVNREELLGRQGLQSLYFTGTSFGTPETASATSRDGPLAFPWRDNPPLPGAFSALWEGSLQAPASGVYRFGFDMASSDSDGQTAFTLQLDDRLVLDSSLGLVEKEEVLAEGFYRLTMRYRTDQTPGDWSVRWQAPGAEPNVIPREALYSPALPDVGLIGVYYGGDSFQGPVLTTRKDLILGSNADLPTPYSVQWEGKLAAPRAGEYLFALTSNGGVRMLVNDKELITYQLGLADSNLAESDLPAYTQASIYLPIGWHDIHIDYVPAESAPELRILWQPPGSTPALLESQYLRPELGQIFPGDAALPPSPPLLDPLLGDDAFALSYSNEMIHPQTVIPPINLPNALLGPVWQAGATCGAEDDQMNMPRGAAIDVDAQRVYVADTGNRRILVFDMHSGERIAAYSDTAFEEPVDLALKPDGGLVVLDAVAHPLFSIDTKTGEIAPMDLDASFYRPRGLDVDAQGVMAVADTGGARVLLLDPQGQSLVQYGGAGTLIGTGQPVDALLTENGAWAITAEDGRLWRLDDQSGLTALPRANTVDGPHLASLADGSFFLTDPVRGSIQYHSSSGQPLYQFTAPELMTVPVGIDAVESEGMLYIAVTDSAQCKVTLWIGRSTPAQQ